MNNKEKKDLDKIIVSNFLKKENEKDNLNNKVIKKSNESLQQNIDCENSKLNAQENKKKINEEHFIDEKDSTNKVKLNEDIATLEKEFNDISKREIPNINKNINTTRKSKFQSRKSLRYKYNNKEASFFADDNLTKTKIEDSFDNNEIEKNNIIKEDVKELVNLINETKDKKNNNMKTKELSNKNNLIANDKKNINIDNKIISNEKEELFDFSKRSTQYLLNDKKTKSTSFWKVALERIFKQKLTMFSILSIIILIILSIIIPTVSGDLAYTQNLDLKNLPPKIPFIENLGILNGYKNGKDVYSLLNVDSYYFFGTDDLGRDLFSRVWLGMRTSLSLAAIIMFIQTIIGTIIGGISGYFGGFIDGAIQRILEVLGNIPTIIVVLVIALVLKASFFTLVISLSLFDWIPFSRLVRAQIISYKNKDFVTASKSLGANSFHIIKTHLFPNILSTFIISITMQFPALILSEAYYTFIGVGLPVGVVSLGQLIVESISKFTVYPYQIYIPTIFMAFISLAFNILGNGLRDALDPTLKERN